MYANDLRTSICDLANQRRAQGERLTVIADSLGISASMLTEWLRRSTRVREVEIEVPTRSSNTSSAKHLSIRLRHGALIEGLSLQDIEYLLGTGKC